MSQHYDIIIAGGGPAGLTAAIYARRAGRSVLLLEKEGFGGQIATAPKVENFPGFSAISGAELADRMYTQAETLGASIEPVSYTHLISSLKFSAFAGVALVSALSAGVSLAPQPDISPSTIVRVSAIVTVFFILDLLFGVFPRPIYVCIAHTRCIIQKDVPRFNAQIRLIFSLWFSKNRQIC